MGKNTTDRILDQTIAVHPRLASCRAEIERAAAAICESYRKGGKLLTCGNGGSAADAEHIVTELMKGFRLKRPLSDAARAAVAGADAELGPVLAERLQGALPAIALTSHPALNTAFSNDVDANLIFAQQLYGYGRKGDVMIALSTSGNSRNLLYAAVLARAIGVTTIAMTGAGGGKLAPLCDIAIRVPETDTPLIQELHLPVYHALCTIVEEEFFGS